NDLGTFLHAEQDSFSHEGFGPVLGHASALTKPDKTYNDVPKANRLAAETYNRLLAAATTLGMDNVPTPFEDLVQLINDFNVAKSDQDKANALEHIKGVIETKRHTESEKLGRTRK